MINAEKLPGKAHWTIYGRGRVWRATRSGNRWQAIEQNGMGYAFARTLRELAADLARPAA